MTKIGIMPATWHMLALAIALGLAACANRADDALEVTTGTVLRNATIVNTRDGSLARGMTIVIEGGKIQRVTASTTVRTSGAAVSVDATGKYVVPGFLDMHTHAMQAADRDPSFWPLLIANGVTGIREMGGSAALIKRAKKLNADRAAGLVVAPEIVLIPGDIFVGRVAAPDLAAAQVRLQKAEGADFIKIVNSSREVTLSILAEARKQGLGVSGHLPPAVSAEEASNAGWRAVEHLGAGLGILLGCSTDEASIRSAVLRGEGAKPPFPPTYISNPLLYSALDAPFYRRITQTFDEGKCQSLAKVLAKNETWQVPTLIRLRTMEFSGSLLYRTDPNLVYVDKTTRALWEGLGRQYADQLVPDAVTAFQAYYGLQQRLTNLLKRNGVKILAGSDLGGIWVIPGFSLHQEFHELATAGLSPLEVLQATTLNAAEFLHRETTMGTVDQGKDADLVLLDANPIVDVANLDKISAVLVNGRYFPRQSLDKMKIGVAEAYASQPLKSLSDATDPTHVH